VSVSVEMAYQPELRLALRLGDTFHTDKWPPSPTTGHPSGSPTYGTPSARFAQQTWIVYKPCGVQVMLERCVTLPNSPAGIVVGTLQEAHDLMESMLSKNTPTGSQSAPPQHDPSSTLQLTRVLCHVPSTAL
jgi:hypothetical protein